MKRRKLIRVILIMALLLLLTAGLGQAQAPETADATESALGTAFTYQGQLVYNSAPVNDTCDFTFSLWDEAGSGEPPAGGTQINYDVTITGVSVSDGLFTVSLDFGVNAFNGEARWLQIRVNCGDGATTLAPRQPLTPAPHALSLPGLYTHQDATSPSLVGGYSGNQVTSGVMGAVISGGGDNSEPNLIHDDYGAIGGGGDNVTGDDDGETTWQHYATVGGGYSNTARGEYATVGGGYENTASHGYATVGGGVDNTASDYNATVGGGESNTASRGYAIVGGGEGNTASGEWATVGGGFRNIANGSVATVGGGESNSTYGDYSTVGGGLYNTADATYATIAGGGPSDTANPDTTNNRVYDDYGAIGGGGGNVVGTDDGDTTEHSYATVGGGYENTASAWSATVGGGWSNTAGDYAATVGGGVYNTASADYATVGGGQHNTAGEPYATVSGGVGNTVGGYSSTVSGGQSNTASGLRATVGGGYDNTASGNYSTVPGGQSNNADGDHSFAAGHRTDANNAGCFVWGDSSDADVSCNTNDRTIFRSSGGFYIYSKSDLTAGIYISANGNSWNSVSDRARKKNLQAVDTQALLDNLAAIDISTWNYKSQDPTIRHIGPMAQDFNALLPDLGGEGELYINTLDADGVALAAIQGLYQLAQEQTTRIEMLEAENTVLQQRLDDLEARITASELTAIVDRIAGGTQ